jgi:hypothetical protein
MRLFKRKNREQPAVATDKQINYIHVLFDELNKRPEDFGLSSYRDDRWGGQHRIAEVLTKEEASKIIDQLLTEKG